MNEILKDNIYVWVEELGEREFQSIHKLVKEYFRLWLEHKIDNFIAIDYRGYQLIIRDRDGLADAITIEQDLESQVDRINQQEYQKEMSK